jgi:hypothetical protein
VLLVSAAFATVLRLSCILLVRNVATVLGLSCAAGERCGTVLRLSCILLVSAVCVNVLGLSCAAGEKCCYCAWAELC